MAKSITLNDVLAAQRAYEEKTDMKASVLYIRQEQLEELLTEVYPSEDIQAIQARAKTTESVFGLQVVLSTRFSVSGGK